jgi:hypothetical protein
MHFIDGVAVGSIHHAQLEEEPELEEAPAESDTKSRKRGATVTSEHVTV